MKVSVAIDQPEVVVTVVGEVDADNGEEFRSALLDTPNQGPALIVDLSELTFIDSSGIGELLQVHRAVTDRGQRLSIRDPSPAVRRVLEITGLLEHFGLSQSSLS